MRRLVLLSTVFLTAADWPQYHGPNRDGVSPESGLARSWPKGGPPVIWKKDSGSGWSGPAVLGDQAILFHRIEDQGGVECVDAATGKTSSNTAPVTWTTSARTTVRGPRP